MLSLADLRDVAALGVDVSDAQFVHFLLSSVSDAVRDAAESPITVTTVTITVPGTKEQFVALPGSPIRSVDTVLLDGVSVGDYKLRDGKLWRPAGWVGQHADVEVTYTFGLDEPPADIRKLVATLVAAGVNERADGVASKRGLAYTRIDDYQEGYRQGSDEVVDLTELPERTRKALRTRFAAGGAYVTGSY